MTTRHPLVLAPMIDPELDGQLAEVNATGRTMVLAPDDDARSALGLNPLDPSVRGPAARAGHAQGGAVAPTVSAFWPG